MTRLRWKVGLAGIELALVLGVAPGARADEGAEKMAAVQQKAQAVQSYRAEFALTVIEEGKPTTLTGTILYQRPDKRRIDFSTAQATDEVAQLVVSDGTVEWQSFPAKKVVYKTDWAKAKAAGASTDALELRGLHQPFIDVKPGSVRFVEAKTDSDQHLYVFEAAPADTLVADAPFTPGTLRVTVSSDDGLTRHLTMTDAQGKEVLNQQYTKVQVGVPVPADQFTFTPPPGAQVIDISEERAGKRPAAPAEPAVPEVPGAKP